MKWPRGSSGGAPSLTEDMRENLPTLLSSAVMEIGSDVGRSLLQRPPGAPDLFLSPPNASSPLTSHTSRRLPQRCCQPVAILFPRPRPSLEFRPHVDSLQPSSNSTTATGSKGISGTDEGRLLCGLGPLKKLALARKLAWKFSAVSVSVECDTSWACI